MKMVRSSAETPDECIACLRGWQRRYAAALRAEVGSALPEAEERWKCGHIDFLMNGPGLLLRAESTRDLCGFETHMTGISAWFHEHPPGNTDA